MSTLSYFNCVSSVVAMSVLFFIIRFPLSLHPLFVPGSYRKMYQHTELQFFLLSDNLIATCINTLTFFFLLSVNLMWVVGVALLELSRAVTRKLLQSPMWW